MTTYYKFLTRNGTGPYSNVPWPLPADGQPGAWMPAVAGDLVLCTNGYHACTEANLMIWLDAALYELEFDGEVVVEDDKVVGRRARLLRRIDTWNGRTARLFAADCAERVLPLFEQRHPDDIRPRQAIAAARAFARGEIDQQALTVAWDAAGAAAWAADGAAAWDAAWAAAKAAAEGAAEGAAWAAAGDAAWAAAWAAAKAAAGDAAEPSERAWQTARLLAYLRGEVA